MPGEKNRALEFEEVFNEPRPKGTNYLFAIGIDQYVHCRKLSNAVGDAKAFVKLLTERFQFEHDFVESLYDNQATRKNIINSFRDFAKKITPVDNLLVYFSGHGHYDDVFKEGHWIPVDAKEEEEDEYISYNKIITIIRAIKSHHTFMIVDSCYSGSIFTEDNRSTVSDRLEKDPSRWLLASGRNEVVSDGFAGEHSPFATQLLSALERYAGEGINARTLVEKVLVATSYNSSQTPTGNPLVGVGDQGGLFVFRPKMDEIYDWKKANNSGSIEAYSFFIKAYPKGKYTELASWKLAMLKNTVAAYDDYLANYPKGKYKKPAMDKQVLAEEDDLWTRCQKARAISNYRQYILRYPEGRFLYKAENALKTLKREAEEEQKEWKDASEKHTTAAYTHYLKSFPKGIHARLAQEELDYLEEREQKAREKRRKEEAEARRKKEEENRKAEEEREKEAEARKQSWAEAKKTLEELAKKRRDDSPSSLLNYKGILNTPKKEEEKPKPESKPKEEGSLLDNLVSGFLSGLAKGAQNQQNTGGNQPPSLNLTGSWRGSDGFVYQLNQQGNIVYCRGVNNFGQIIAEGQGNLNGNQLTLNVRNLNGTNSTAHMAVSPNARQMQGTVSNQFYGSQAMSLWR